MSAPTRIGFALFPRFSQIAFAAALQPLYLANWLSGEHLFEWRVMAPDDGPVVASNGIRICTDTTLEDWPGMSLLLVCASFDPQAHTTRSVLGYLQRQSRQGIALGALDTGSHLLGSAGLLDGYQATIHWEHLAGFTEAFPRVHATHDIYVVDRNRLTSAGGTAGLDMMLNLIHTRHGAALAAAVADEVIHPRIREPRDPQRMPLRARLGTADAQVIRAVEIMEANLETPLALDDIAARAGASLRQLERRFARSLRTTPAAHYRELRLARARTLLQQTDMRLTRIMLACGFRSNAHFSRSYRARFGHPPSAERRA